MNPHSTFYASSLGLAEYQPASVTYVQQVSIAAYPFKCWLHITCSVGHAPRVAIDFGQGGDFGTGKTRGPPLTLDQWNELRSAVSDCWASLEIRCTCGHPFGRHAAAGPHGCASSQGCLCSRFSASEPLCNRDDQLLEKKQ